MSRLAKERRVQATPDSGPDKVAGNGERSRQARQLLDAVLDATIAPASQKKKQNSGKWEIYWKRYLQIQGGLHVQVTGGVQL